MCVGIVDVLNFGACMGWISFCLQWQRDRTGHRIQWKVLVIGQEVFMYHENELFSPCMKELASAVQPKSPTKMLHVMVSREYYLWGPGGKKSTTLDDTLNILSDLEKVA